MLKLVYMTDLTCEREQFIRNITENQFVCAAAGTGKTTVLVRRYLEILLSGAADCDQIIAITFTDKAANEMKERVRSSILKNEAGLEPAKIASLIERLNTAPISTVHGFCLRILRDNIGELPFDPLFKICDETAEALLRDQFWQKFLERKIAERDPDLTILINSITLAELSKLLDLIYEKQAECAPILERYKNLNVTSHLADIEKACRNYNLQLLYEYFSDKTISDIINQISTFKSSKSDDVLQRDFCIILTASAEVLGRRQIPVSVRDGSLRKALGGGKKGTAAAWGNELETVREFHSQLAAKFRLIKDEFHTFDPEIEKLHADVMQSLAHLALDFLQEYRAEMRRKALLDFTGIELETENLLARRSPEIVRYIRNFKHLLVDEFQDINPIQYRIIQLLQELNPDLITFFVGDEKQSIYRFRGAEVEIFNTLREQSDVQPLSINYRSVQALMNFYNFFFAQFLGSTPPAERYAAHYPLPIAAKDNSISTEPPVELLVIEEDEEFAARPRQESPKDEVLEAQAIANRIWQLHKAEIIRENGVIREAEFGDMTILLRSRTHQSQFTEALRQAGIPFYVVTGIGFYDQPEIVDLINYLRVLLNWHDEVALVGTLRSPLVGLNDATLTELAREESLWKGINQYLKNGKEFVLEADEAARLKNFYRNYTELNKQITQLSTAEIINQIVELTNFTALLAGLPDGTQKIANVKKLIDLALEWEKAESLSPIDFIRRIRIYRDKEVREGEANLSAAKGDAVTIMTIHAAKGLDSQIVFLPLLADKINYRSDRFLFHSDIGAAVAIKADKNQPHPFHYNQLKHLERRRTLAEEKRLLYVAMTRARSYLVCSATVSGKSDEPDKSLWDLSAEIFVRAHEKNLCRIVKLTKTEIEQTALPSGISLVQPVELNDETLRRIRTQIQPLEFKPPIRNLTATALAEWVVAGEKIASTAEPEDDQALSPQELGTLIHKAFSWWDFQSLDSFQNMLADLLRPYRLTAPESQKISAELSDWVKQLLDSDNHLRQRLTSARNRRREVEVVGLYGEMILEGKIDLLIENDDNTLTIIDFKSDRIAEKPDEVLLKKYSTQLDFYAFILERSSGRKVREQALYFIRNGLLITKTITESVLDEAEQNIRKYISELAK